MTLNMNNNFYEDTILNLLERVSNLEKEIIKMKNGNNHSNIETSDNNKQKAYSKDEIIEELKNELSTWNMIVSKRKTKEGGGLLIHNSHNIPLKVYFSSSRDYAKQNNIVFRGWHTISQEKINEFDKFIFIIQKNEELNYFVFSQSEMKNLISQKTKDSKGIYHFYFAERSNGETIDLRDNIVLGNNKNNWKILN